MNPELPFSSISYITPHFRPRESHLCILALKIKRRAQDWEFNCDFRKKRGFCSRFQDFSPHKCLWVRKNFSKYENLNFSHNFQTQGILSSNFKLFLSSNPMRHTFSSRIVKNLFSAESHEIHLRIEWDMFLQDPEWKYYHMKPCSIFQFLVEFSSPTHYFGCSANLSSLWV